MSAEMTPVITLWQPWASLIFTGDKWHETRGFPYPAKHDGRTIAIHAAAKFPPRSEISDALHALCNLRFGLGYSQLLPLGAILGTVRLAGCCDADPATVPHHEEDLICGNWGAGRYAWALKGVHRLDNPVPAKGKQGWWKTPLALPCDSDSNSDPTGEDPQGLSAPASQSGAENTAHRPTPEGDT